MRTIKKGATDQTVYVEVLDSTSTTGGRKTGLVYNSSGLTAYYARNGAAAAAITLATLAAANSAHSDGGFKEVDATNMPGIYRLDLPDAAVASGAESVVITLKGVTGMAQVSTEIQLVDNTAKDIYDRLGAPAGASAAADIAAIKTQTAAIEVDTQDIQSRIPAALVSGRIDASVGAMAANVMTAAAAASDLTTELQSGLATAASLTTVAGYIDTEVAAILAAVDTEVAAIKAKTDNLPASPASETLLTTVAGYLDTEIAAIKAKTDNLPASPAAVSDIPTAAAVADAVWDEAISGHLTAGSTGNALNAAGSAGDPWSTPLPGAYGSGTAGKILGDNLDATVSSRASQTSVDTVDDFLDTEIAAIKAKTDNLPGDPADASDIATAFSTVNGTLATIAGYVDTEVAAIKAKTDLIPGTQDGKTYAETLRLMAAVLLGKASGLDTDTAVYRAIDDSKTRVTATVDANGNRTAVTLDAS